MPTLLYTVKSSETKCWAKHCRCSIQAKAGDDGMQISALHSSGRATDKIRTSWALLFILTMVCSDTGHSTLQITTEMCC